MIPSAEEDWWLTGMPSRSPLELILAGSDFLEHSRRLLTGHADRPHQCRIVGTQERVGRLLRSDGRRQRRLAVLDELLYFRGARFQRRVVRVDAERESRV